MPTLSPMSGKHAAYALTASQSKGRHHPEPAHAFRGLFERDRDRVVHSTAFRRLVNKTQVFPSPTNDHHRTRLTHTLEVAQISRVVARQIGLEEDLTEAIALAHDLGHPPFGHAGEDELRQFMKEHGGFEHNSHAFPDSTFRGRFVRHLLITAKATIPPSMNIKPLVALFWRLRLPTKWIAWLIMRTMLKMR